MIDFFVMIARFFRAVWRSLKRERAARALLAFVILILLSGTIFFVEVEHWSPIDALYYCVTTLATVGSGELRPHTDMGKIFTVVYIFMGVGAVVATLQLIARHALADEHEAFSKIGKKLTNKK
ncbi:MAG TPA: potassium channel family protein [Candidatus Saccharimonadales bacterium]|nr:potassium channel family protein [Candidatus Saccharimonadales bacterium]